LTVAAAPAIDAAPIIWDPATTISTDTDIMTTGGLVYAFNASNTSQTVNGVTFTGVSSQTAWGTGVSLNLAASPGNNVSAFDDGGWGAFGGGASYKAMLAGASYNAGAAATITLNTLTSGHRYPALPPGTAAPAGTRQLPNALHEALRLLAEPGPIRG
jgi:hypothetical protein